MRLSNYPSKDKFVRVWDLETQHCMQIISAHHTEIWSIDIDLEERYLATGLADPELRFYTIKHDFVDERSLLKLNGPEAVGSENSFVQNKWEFLTLFGEIQRQSKDRVAIMRFNKSGNLLACQVAGKIVEILCVLDEIESKRKAKRRIHQKEKKSVKEAVDVNGDVNPSTGKESSIPTLTI